MAAFDEKEYIQDFDWSIWKRIFPIMGRYKGFLAGMTACKARIQTIPDRTSAIRWALTHAKKGDVVLLAGKGHETYQILNTGKIHYDEREIVADILKGKK